MNDARGMGEGRARTTPHTPKPRGVPGGYAGHARVRQGLGLGHPPRDLVAMGVQHTPTPRLVAPGARGP
jgi:hypothetical protein